jgi:proteic killer suppression protein
MVPNRDRTDNKGHGGFVSSEVPGLAVLPGNRFEALRGDRKGQYSIRINDQWRICFEWLEERPGPSNVEIVDYH